MDDEPEPTYHDHVAVDGSECRCTDPEGNWHGVAPRSCGEHRTVGRHRAWCHPCGEWCYPRSPCRGCAEGVPEGWACVARLPWARYRVAWVGDAWDVYAPDRRGT